MKLISFPGFSSFPPRSPLESLINKDNIVDDKQATQEGKVQIDVGQVEKSQLKVTLVLVQYLVQPNGTTLATLFTQMAMI